MQQLGCRQPLASANDQQNKRKFGCTYVVVARVPNSVQVSLSYGLVFVDFVAEVLEMYDKLRLGKFRHWIYTAEFPPDSTNLFTQPPR